MVAKLEDIKKWYAEFNAKYFKSVGRGLPDNIEIVMSNRMSSTWGRAEFYIYAKNKLTGEAKPINDPEVKSALRSLDYRDWKPYAAKLCIKINAKNDIPEKAYQNTLIHEMIHIEDYVYFFDHFYSFNGNGVKPLRYDAHGDWFKAECDRINQDGWRLQKYVSDEDLQSSVASKASEGYIMCIGQCTSIWCNGKWKPLDNDSIYYFMFKTNKANLNKVIKSIKSGYNNYSKIMAYECHDAKYANVRNCVTKVLGWKLTEEKMKETIKNLDLKLINTFDVWNK